MDLDPRGDVFVLGLVESIAELDPEVLIFLCSDATDWEMWDLVLVDDGYIFLALAPAVEGEAAKGGFGEKRSG